MVHSACFAGLRFGSRNYCTSLPAEPDSFDVERGACFATDCLVAISRNGLEGYTEVLDLYCAGLNQVERVRLKEVETVAHQRSVTNANELFKLNYVASSKCSLPMNVIWIANWNVSTSSPIFAGKRSFSTGRWAVVAKAFRRKDGCRRFASVFLVIMEFLFHPDELFILLHRS